MNPPVVEEHVEQIDETTGTKWYFWVAGTAIIFALLAIVRANLQQPGESEKGRPLLAINEVAPELIAQGWINGDAPTVNTFANKVVVVEAWGSACHVCWKIAPDMVEVHEMYEGKDVEFVGLTAQGKFFLDDVNAFIDENKISWLNGYGAEATMRRFGIGSLPAIFVVGRDGRVVWNHKSEGTFTEAIDAALGTPETATASLSK